MSTWTLETHAFCIRTAYPNESYGRNNFEQTNLNLFATLYSGLGN